MGRGQSAQRPLALVAHEGFSMGGLKGWRVSEESNIPSWVNFNHDNGSDVMTVRALQGMGQLLINEESLTGGPFDMRFASAHCWFDQRTSTCESSGGRSNFEHLHASFARVASDLGVCSVEELKSADLSVIAHNVDHVVVNFANSLTTLTIIGGSKVLSFAFWAPLAGSSSSSSPPNLEDAFLVHNATVEVTLHESLVRARSCSTCRSETCFHMRVLGAIQERDWSVHEKLLLSCEEDIPD